MNIILAILLGILVLITLILMLALFIKKEYTLTREIIIKKARQDVYNYLKYLKNQDHYSNG